jgi:hypothetical protein
MVLVANCNFRNTECQYARRVSMIPLPDTGTSSPCTVTPATLGQTPDPTSNTIRQDSNTPAAANRGPYPPAPDQGSSDDRKLLELELMHR